MNRTVERAVRAGRTVGRGAVRGWGRSTASVRPLPDFLLVGAKRAGTTFLFRSVVAHPQALPLFPSSRRLPMRADLKGVHFFDAHVTRGEAWYRSHFPSVAARRRVERRVGRPSVAGEATPYYLHHPLAAGRARSVVPDVRVVVLLRDPAERAWSHWKTQRRRGIEPLDRFEAALDAEPARLAADGDDERLERDPAARSFAHEHLSYVGTSRYLEPLRRWERCFPPQQLLVLASEDLYRDPDAVYGRVLSFLGLPAVAAPGLPVPNPTAGDLDPGLRRRLDEQLAPEVAALEAHLGRTFGWGSSP